MSDRTRTVRRSPGDGHRTQLPYVLEYRDTGRHAWREWDGFNSTLSAAWEAHTVFGGPRPAEDA